MPHLYVSLLFYAIVKHTTAPIGSSVEGLCAVHVSAMLYIGSLASSGRSLST